MDFHGGLNNGGFYMCILFPWSLVLYNYCLDFQKCSFCRRPVNLPKRLKARNRIIGRGKHPDHGKTLLAIKAGNGKSSSFVCSGLYIYIYNPLHMEVCKRAGEIIYENVPGCHVLVLEGKSTVDVIISHNCDGSLIGKSKLNCLRITLMTSKAKTVL